MAKAGWMAFAVAMAGAVAFAEPCRIVVNPGDSLEKARDAVRALPSESRARGVEVLLSPGRHLLTRTLALDSRDGGDSRAPVVWRSAPGGRATVSSGVQIPVSAFSPAGDANPRVDPAVRARVLAADLAPFGVECRKTPRREMRRPLPIPELFVDGVRMTAAQWPNDGWSTIARFVDEGTRDNDGGVWEGVSGAKKGKPVPPRGGVFGYVGDRPSRWTNAPEVLLYGFWCFDWYDAVIPVASIDSTSNTIALAVKHTYGLRAGNPSPRRWKAVHLLEELDAPGEYYVDAEAKKLYLYPPTGFGVHSRVVIASRPGDLFKIDGARDLEIRDVDFEEGYDNAIHATRSARVKIDSCRFRNLRRKAVVMHGCTECAIVGCDVSDTGTGGLDVHGGDRRTLSASGNVVEDVLVRDFSQHCLTYASAIHLGGVGNVVRHCEISGAPHMAIGVYGNDNVVEYCVVSNVCMSSDDAAAFYKGRNPSCRGNVLRYNFWSEIGSPRGHGNAAIYFDDGDCGDSVVGNVFYRCGEPGFGGFGTVFCHGGHSNLVENSVFVECRRPLGSAPWDQKRWEGFLKSPLEQTRLLGEVCVTDSVWTAHYPAIKSIFTPESDAERWNLARNSAFVKCPATLPGRKPGETRPGILCGRWATNATDVVFDSDPGFVNASAKDFTLKSDSEILKRIPEFKPIPFEKIGLLRKR